MNIGDRVRFELHPFFDGTGGEAYFEKVGEIVGDDPQPAARRPSVFMVRFEDGHQEYIVEQCLRLVSAT